MPSDSPKVSVALCTHNPNPDYLARTLDGLRQQTLDFTVWELLLVDNASSPALEADLSWHPRARIVRGEQVGLTHARSLGIRESKAEILVFVDDDNVLDPDYLEVALRLARDWPQLGTWGGQTIGAFERPPEEWTRDFWLWIAVRELSKDRWSNVPREHAALPYGAGMCVRRHVAEAYLDLLASNPHRKALDRSGKSLLGGGDADLSFTACDLGLGNGVFPALKLTHLIPARRLEETYLRGLVISMTYSQTLLFYFRGEQPHPHSRSQRLLQWWELRHVDARTRRFEQAKQAGREAAMADIERIRRGLSPIGPSHLLP